MKIITFPFVYLFELIRENIFKTIFITLTCIFFSYAGSIPDQPHERNILKEMQMNGEWVYLYKTSDGIEAYSQIKREKLVGKDKNIVKWKEYAGGNAALWLGFIVFLIITIVMMCSEDGYWDFHEVFENTIKYYIRCEIEDNVYVYTIFGRLIEKSSYQTTRFNICKLRDITILPKYKLRSDKRNEKLNQIGIR